MEFTIIRDRAIAEIDIVKYEHNLYSYSWIDRFTKREVYQSKKLRASSIEAILFIGLIDCIAYFDEEKIIYTVCCFNKKVAHWFQNISVENIDNFETDIQDKLNLCLNWMKENHASINNIKMKPLKQ